MYNKGGMDSESADDKRYRMQMQKRGAYSDGGTIQELEEELSEEDLKDFEEQRAQDEMDRKMNEAHKKFEEDQREGKMSGGKMKYAEGSVAKRFDAAFIKARKKGEDTFEFEGESYSTDTADERLSERREKNRVEDEDGLDYTQAGARRRQKKYDDYVVEHRDDDLSRPAQMRADALIKEKEEKAEALKKKNMGGMLKYNEGSMLVPPEMEMQGDMPEDTYDNIPEDEKEAAEASQLPDAEMEEDYVGYVLGESLDTEEQEYLMGVLEGDERLSGIFDKVMDVAGEFSGEGEVKGLGTGVSDSIPARLSDGEFVFTKKATDQMGADQLQTMMDEAEKAYDGGLMKKAFGGLTSEDDMDSYDSEEEVKKQMISANQMPSIR